MKRLCTLATSLGLALPALAQSADTYIPFDADHVRHVRIGPSRQPGTRGELFYYSNFQPGYFNTGSTPRWHTGDVIQLDPPGVTNALVDTVRIGIVPTLGPAQEFDVVVTFYDDFDGHSAPARLGVFQSDRRFFFNTGPIDSGFIYLFELDLSAFPGGGITLPDDSVGVEVINACVGHRRQRDADPVSGRNVGLRELRSAGPDVGLSDDFYIRDANGKRYFREHRVPVLRRPAEHRELRAGSVEPRGDGRTDRPLLHRQPVELPGDHRWRVRHGRWRLRRR
jgi:hypothetical protein